MSQAIQENGTSFSLDEEDVYPTDETLKLISEYSLLDKSGKQLLDEIRPIWNYADSGYWHVEETDTHYKYHISTAGWSGNEDIIRALQKNFIFWHMYWYSSRRGGHHVFELRKVKNELQ